MSGGIWGNFRGRRCGFPDGLGRSRWKSFHSVGNGQDECMLVPRLESKRRFRMTLVPQAARGDVRKSVPEPAHEQGFRHSNSRSMICQGLRFSF